MLFSKDVKALMVRIGVVQESWIPTYTQMCIYEEFVKTKKVLSQEIINYGTRCKLIKIDRPQKTKAI
jgi:hypothetical protein